MNSKSCNTCKIEKDVASFSSNKNSIDGLSYYCKPCTKDMKKNSTKYPPKMTGSKNCSKCLKVKKLVDFIKCRDVKDGRGSSCIECKSLYRESYNNSEKGKATRLRAINNYANNIEEMRARKKTPRARKIKQEWRNRNRAYLRAKVAKERASRIQRTPNWLSEFDLDYIKSLYIQAKWLEDLEGVKYHIDHIVPLNGENVSGLHVPWNLQIMNAIDNIKKGNSFE